jgi:arsenate reductase
VSECTLYHNKKCSKSRKALEILTELDIDINVVHYMDSPLSPSEVRLIIQNSNASPSAFIRKKEANFSPFQKMNSDNIDEVAALLAKKPELMERPIVEYKNKTIIARPPEKIRELLFRGI